MSKMKVQHAIYINLPVEEVFAYMSNLENLAEWSGFVLSSRKISSGETRIGTIIQCSIRILGTRFETAYEIVEYRLNHYFSYKSIMGIASSFTYIHFEPVEGGTQVLTDTDIFFTGGYMGFDKALVTHAISHQLANDMQTLQDLLEITSSTSK